MASLAPNAPIDYKTLVQDDRIHASLYTDPRIFDDELERIFHRGWVFVGHDSEIPRPGDFVTRHVGTEPVIMVRGKDGAVSRSEEHTSELQSLAYLVCRLLLEKKKQKL